MSSLSEVELCSDDQWCEGEMEEYGGRLGPVLVSDGELYNILGGLASDSRTGCSPIRRGWDGVVRGRARAKLRKLLSSHACRE